MRRWNGWGDEATHYPMPNGGEAFLADRLGPGIVLPDASIEDVIGRVPTSRLPEDLLIDRSPETRIRHSRGQSLPDWLAVRSGDFAVFTDGVAFPKNKEEIRSLMSRAQREGWTLITYGGGTSVAGHITPQAQDIEDWQTIVLMYIPKELQAMFMTVWRPISLTAQMQRWFSAL